MIRILVVDDQALVRAGFGSILEKQADFDVVGEAANGHEALEMAAGTNVDVVLMDLRMPVMDGLAATRELMRRQSPPRIIVLTTFDADQHVYQSLRAGAAGFLLKDTPPEKLIQAVREVMSGDSMLSPAVTKRLIEAYVSAPSPDDGGVPEAFAHLTERELDVLRHLAQAVVHAYEKGLVRPTAK